jgi:hypothetical protein
MTKREFQQAVDAIITGTGHALRMKRALKARDISSTIDFDELKHAYEMTEKAIDHFDELTAALQKFSYDRDEKSLA